MIKNLELAINAREGADLDVLPGKVRSKLGLGLKQRVQVRIRRRSIDARGKSVKIRFVLDAYIDEDLPNERTYYFDFESVHKADPVIIVGAGPAGLFAALQLIELGLKPIVLERGKDVQTRRRDIAAINRFHKVDPDSNYCFGEGGAGTYSDGKLYTRSTKRGDVRRVLEIFVHHGAHSDILIDAHPHIGTNKLPGIIQNIRGNIIAAGGEIYFDTRVSDLLLSNGRIKGVMTQKGEKINGLATLLATGHSARDIYLLLEHKGVSISSKPFALGVRIEHAQEMIDKIQYGRSQNEYLPAASYSLTCQTNYQDQPRGVFSFCMCPGGFIVPSATSEGEVVVNGMSPSRRNSQFANSGVVVSVEPEDVYPAYRRHGSLSSMAFQADLEQKACQAAGGTQAAPAQRLMDMLDGKISGSLTGCSYQPGLVSTSLDDVLPPDVMTRLRSALQLFGSKMKGYLTNEALVVAVESRTSSPVRIPRDQVTREHPDVAGLYPVGEGAGYAGGIVSAAIDGMESAKCAANMYGKSKLKSAV